MPCDNILNYEVSAVGLQSVLEQSLTIQIVLANGHIVNANQESNADLYKALKGGSNNFGVVTRLDLRAIPQGEFWGGVAFYNSSLIPALLDNLSAFDQGDSYDPFSQLTVLFGRAGNNTISITH